MSGFAAILRRSCLTAASENLMETCVGPCMYSGNSLRWLSSCAKQSTKPGTSILGQIKAVDSFAPVNGMSRARMMPLSAHMGTNWLITSKPRFNVLPAPLGVLSIRRAYSSDTGHPEVSQNIPIVPSTETSDVGTAGKKVKEMTDAITPHVQQFFAANPDLEKVAVPLGGTLFGTVMAWFVMPIILRRLHKYGSQNPITALLGNSTKTDASYQTSIWSAVEDPAKYLITFMAFSEMAAAVAPSISPYFPQALRGAFVLSIVWFLHRWKANFITTAMTSQTALVTDKARLSAFNKVSSLGLIALGVMGLAEACGVAVQSILTVGGVGGVATAFAARDVLGNVLNGFSLQFSRPFSVGEYIKAGSIEGTVVEIGLTSTSLINPEKLPVTVPNSLFSSQVIVNKSRGQLRLSVTKIPIRLEDIQKVPAISEEINAMLRSNPKVVSETDAPYCHLSKLESSYGELVIGCILQKMRKDELLYTEQDILLKAAKIIKSHGVELGSTTQCC
ncbi:mechanosensitive ion channel protein 1, mitochondrial isoform X2 [Brachypodium distachyon]|uniref:Mechanosensitive ion channel MscS domain-containing protein n=1 Tax=Brachypodium distachyon TaxID=15368 RepID=A0A0Q3IDI6_BRADI|nr:mechanosensitive ion channel protein 1, mitochondrial isoform X2 [Brachypodium distachyon]KQJ84176.1 hypothetical protein BRADI_5g19160v3 [Brachypodium distachyon]PNT61701.1 hypothetical protein BRADI_5g19160v3 [Brachypodium distachyon]|eukprot:XP_024311657.1 mechanosensitive ion channel protein 1, mitochondrial isoform X2 [Brachypodium distachyon]